MKIVSIAVAILFSIITGLVFVSAHSTESIKPLEAKKLLDSNQAILVDVRELDEVLLGSIKGKIHLPMSLMTSSTDDFDQQVNKLPKNKKIIVYCRSGRRSNLMGIELGKRGFNVLNLGSYDEWKKAIPN